MSNIEPGHGFHGYTIKVKWSGRPVLAAADNTGSESGEIVGREFGRLKGRGDLKRERAEQRRLCCRKIVCGELRESGRTR
jgi:hypothetical protein